MIIAVYRVLYGEDFVAESIKSIAPHVDRIVVVQAPRPWGRSEGVTWRGQWIAWPSAFDNLAPKARAASDKVEVVEDFYPTPFGQYEHIVDDVLKLSAPADIVFVEPDHVFSDEQAALAFDSWHHSPQFAATTRQVELWAPPGYKPEWRVPERPGRASVIFWRAVTRGSDLCSPIGVLGAHVHNLGFCFSERTMRWKHLTALAYAAEIGDNPPDPDWFEKKWLAWHPEKNNSDLEIAAGLGYKIPKVVPYDARELPASIRARYGV